MPSCVYKYENLDLPQKESRGKPERHDLPPTLPQAPPLSNPKTPALEAAGLDIFHLFESLF